MTITKLAFAAGITKVDSDLASEGRWIDGDKVRFVKGLPEKIGGWSRLLDTAVTGACRGGHAWIDNSEVKRLALGTHKKLYVYRSSLLYDVTPQRELATGTLTNKLSTTSGDATVTVEHTAHGQKTGDIVQLDAASTVGGLTIWGAYEISVIDDNSYTIEAAFAAASTESSGGGATSYYYPRSVLTDPFSAISGSAVVTVTHASHGMSDGETIYFDDATAVGGITIDGEYAVTVTGSNAYTITHSSAATSTASGGGSVTYTQDVAIGQQDSYDAHGYGVGGYGLGTYGSPRTSSLTISARTWYIDNRGADLFACPRGGDIYRWDPTMESSRAFRVLNAPRSNVGMLVTEEAMLMALGPDGDNMAVSWSDQDDFTNWTPSDVTTAGGWTLSGGSTLVGGLSLQGGVIILYSDAACFAVQYTGDEFVYAQRRLASTGLVGPNAVAEFSGVAYWMNESDFWIYDGSIRTLPSDDIRSYVFSDINTTQRAKCLAGVNKDFLEIWFFYCSSSSSEIDRYVIFSIRDGVWSIGTLARTTWVPKDVYSLPIAVDASGYIYEHESGTNNNGAAINSYIESAPSDIGDGEETMMILAAIPDTKSLSGTLSLYVMTRDWPNSTETTDGPYSITASSEKIDDLRSDGVAGRQAAIKLQSNEIGGHFRLGVMRFDIEPNGAR